MNHIHLLLLFLIIFPFKLLSANQMQAQLVFKELNQPPIISDPVEVVIDKINLKCIPDAILEYYYYNLTNEDVLEIKMIVDTLENERNLNILTRQAGSGYLYVNAMIADWACTFFPIDYIIDQDTVNSKPMVNKLISLSKVYVESVTFKDQGRVVLIKTKEIR